MELTNELARDPVAFLVNRKDQYDYTPLHYAIEDIPTIKLLVSHGADVNICGSYEALPLHMAAHVNNVEAAQYLLDKGSFLESRDRYGQTPLEVAVFRGSFDIFELLVKREATVKRTVARSRWTGNNVLFLCCRALGEHRDEDRVRILLVLLRIGLNPDKVNISRVAPAHIVLPVHALRGLFLSRTLSLEGTPPIFCENLRYSERIRAAFDDDKFHLLVRAYGKETVARVINIHPAVDSESCSPLCFAASDNSIPMMQNMILIGADIEFEGCMSGTALMAACDYGRLDAVKFLVRRGARLLYSCDKGSEGRPPLHRSAIVAAREHPDVLRWLLVERHTEQLKIMGRAENGDHAASSEGSNEVHCWSGPTRAGMTLRTSEGRQIWESSLQWLAKLRRIRQDLSGRVIPRAELWPELDDEGTDI